MDRAGIEGLFRERFGSSPTVVAVAPGRVNLIGEHTDYNDGFVFPVAIDREVWVAAMPNDGDSVLWSREMGEAPRFDVQTVEPGVPVAWAKYPAGTGWVLREGHVLPNLKAAVASDVPMGSGVSSSAALEMAFAVLWNRLGDLGLGNSELAKRAQRAENRFVGVNCGIMDQMASAMGRADSALFLDTRSLEIRYAPIPKQLSIVLCDTGKPRALTESAYNERRLQCESAARKLGVPALRDTDLDALERAQGLDPVEFRRARHVVTENARCESFLEALNAGDLEGVGYLMRESHQSLRDDYEVSCAELDAMAEAAWSSPGCVGARMTGAGFGGACVALVRESEVGAFQRAVLHAFAVSTGREGNAMVCRAVDGARVL